MDLTLFIDDLWISPYALSAFVGLREKGLQFETRELSLRDGQHWKGDYQDGALTGRVPALRHGDFWVAESSAIVEYLDDAFPKLPRLLPENPQERARARQLMAWVRSDLLPIRDERPTTSLFYQAEKKPLSDAARTASERVLKVADRLIYEGRTTLFQGWSIADTDFALMLNRLVHSGHPVLPKVQRYVDANWSRASVSEWVRHPRKPRPAGV
jgi:glutathione S-transferase